MKRLILMISVFALALASGAASAQLGGLMGKKDNKGGADPEAFLASFVESYTHTLTAQAIFAESFNLQDQAALLRAEQQALSSGQLDTDALEKTREVSANAQQVIAQKMEETPELDENSRGMFAEGLVHYGKALVVGKQTVDSAQGVTSSISGNPLSLRGSAKTALAVAKETPAYFNSLRESTSMVFSYAKRNNLEPPADATALLSGL